MKIKMFMMAALLSVGALTAAVAQQSCNKPKAKTECCQKSCDKKSDCSKASCAKSSTCDKAKSGACKAKSGTQSGTKAACPKAQK